MRNIVDVGDAETFHDTVFPTKPYRWQMEVLKGIEAVILAKHRGELPAGLILTLIASRQAGKNEVNARLESRMLALHRGSERRWEAVKGAPTRAPQLIISKERLKTVQNTPIFQNILQPKWREWYMLECGQCKLSLLSADDNANAVGHTASLFLSVDETQDVKRQNFEKVFAPMVDSTGAPSLFSGTEWDKDSLLHHMRNASEDLQRKLKVKLCHIVPWWRVAEENAQYGEAVQAKIARWGATHVNIKTMYECEPADGVGNMFEVADIANCIGNHQRQSERMFGRTYVAGVDFCGAAKPDLKKALEGDVLREDRDATVATVAECSFIWNKHDNTKMAMIRIVDHLYLENKNPYETVNELYSFLFDKWACARVVLDATGVGNGPAAMMHHRRPKQCHPVMTTYQLKSDLGHNVVGAMKSGRLSMYRDDGSNEWRLWMREFKECRRHELRENGQIRWGAPRTKLDGESVHDDFCLSTAYCLKAAEEHLAANHDPTQSSVSNMFEDDAWE